VTNIFNVIEDPVSAVSFVHDYVEIHFNGPILRMNVLPRIFWNDKVVEPLAAGWRDLLCEVIGKKIKKIDIDDSRYCCIDFVNSITVHIDFNSSQGESMEFLAVTGGPIALW
jgi:hypothetical protein